MTARWQQGLSDAAATLQAAPWLAPKVNEVGVRVFDVMHAILRDQDPATAKTRAADTDRPAKKPVKRTTSDHPKVKKSA